MKKIYITLLLFAFATAGAQIVNIPDAAFKNRLILEGVDTNSDGDIQQTEAQSVTETLNLQSAGIANLTGISAFTNMKNLWVENNNLTTLSITDMPSLKVLNCGGNNMTSLTVANLASIDSLNVESNLLPSLDVSTLGSLKSLNAGFNHISNLNVTNNTQLKILNCTANWLNLGALVIPASNVIETLICSSNNSFGLTTTGFNSLKYLDCSNNSYTTLTVSNLPNLETLICGNNNLNGGLNLSNLPALTRLDCGGSSLTVLDVSTFPLLEYLDCSASHLTSLNVTGLENLQYIFTALNELTALEVSTNTALKRLECGSNELSSLDVSNLAALEQLGCWGNNIADLNLSGNPMLYDLNCGGNQLTSLDVSQLPALQQLGCNDNQLTTLDCSNNSQLQFVAFYANQLTSAFFKNGSYEGFDNANFMENPNLVYICVDEFQIVDVQQQAGENVSVNSYCSFTPGGDHNTITGTMRVDIDNDGCDTDDYATPYVKMTMDDGEQVGATFSNQSGVYEFFMGAGGYSLYPALENPEYFLLFLPIVDNFPALDNSTHVHDYCIAPEGVHSDLEVVVAPIVPARPGFEAIYKIVYHNKGNQTNNGMVRFDFDNTRMQLVSALPAQDNQTANQLTFFYYDLKPFESREIIVRMNINMPSDTPAVNVGDILDFNAEIFLNGDDEHPNDNIFPYHQTVIGSYDPNDLTCIEGAVVSPTEIGNYLHYIANFENTGTDAAVNIVVKMDIDETQFDVNSLRVMNSSHSADVRVIGNKAEYIFQDINLAIGGHGNILLKMKTNNTLVAGDVVSNRADIYFDYNLPVATNNADTAFEALGVPGNEQDQSISIYPNPAQNSVNIQAASEIKSVALYDVQGRLLQVSQRDDVSVSFDISERQSGIYFLKITTEKGVKAQKLIKQ